MLRIACVRFWLSRLIAAESFADTRCTGLGLARTDEVSGPLTCNLAILSYADGKLTLSTDMRYPVTLSGDDLIKDYEKTLAALGAKLIVNAHGKPLYVDAASPLIKKLLEAYKNVTGIDDQALPSYLITVPPAPAAQTLFVLLPLTRYRFWVAPVGTVAHALPV